MDQHDLDNRFAFHPARDSGVAERHEAVRDCLRIAAANLDDLCPDGREKSLAVTKLEEAMMWANAAIARHPFSEKAPGAAQCGWPSTPCVMAERAR